MKKILFLALALSVAGLACSTAQKAQSAAVTQGISGQVTEAVGNQMPMKGAPPQVPQGVLTEVLVYEPTHVSQVNRAGDSPIYTAIRTKQVASVSTDSTGHFSVALPVGSYSLFVKLKDGRLYSNLFDSNNNIALFAVEENKITTTRLTISRRASY